MLLLNLTAVKGLMKRTTWGPAAQPNFIAFVVSSAAGEEGPTPMAVRLTALRCLNNAFKCALPPSLCVFPLRQSLKFPERGVIFANGATPLPALTALLFLDIRRCGPWWCHNAWTFWTPWETPSLSRARTSTWPMPLSSTTTPSTSTPSTSRNRKVGSSFLPKPSHLPRPDCGGGHRRGEVASNCTAE